MRQIRSRSTTTHTTDTHPHTAQAETRSILHQPKAVWAVAAASVIAFMGIGLVDPILPAIAEGLDATEAQTELLFTSYLLITGLAMFFTSWLSSRIGAKPTLMIGLVLIVVFAAAAGFSPSVEAIIGFRAGWGLGNALFISTALATIVGAATGGASRAIVLYEAALGLGIAVGPLLGGLLGSWAWQGPFFGTAVLMAIGFIAIVTLLKTDTARPTPTKLSAPFAALRIPALGTLAATALFYNIGFFVLLAYTPFPLGLDAMGLGLTFFGWGVAVAVTSVFVAPILTARMPRHHILRIMLPLLAADLVVAGLMIHVTLALILCVIVGGLFLGVLNTVLTEAVMEATTLPNAVASSAYSGVRFMGGAIAPPAAALIAATLSPAWAYYFGAASVVIAALIVIIGARTLARVDEPVPDELEEAEVLTVADA